MSIQIFNNGPHYDHLTELRLTFTLDVEYGTSARVLVACMLNFIAYIMDYASIIGRGCNSMRALRRLELGLCPKGQGPDDRGYGQYVDNQTYNSKGAMFFNRLSRVLRLTHIIDLSLTYMTTQDNRLAMLLATGREIRYLRLSLIIFCEEADWTDTLEAFPKLTNLEELHLHGLNCGQRGIHFGDGSDNCTHFQYQKSSPGHHFPRYYTYVNHRFTFYHLRTDIGCDCVL